MDTTATTGLSFISPFVLLCSSITDIAAILASDRTRTLTLTPTLRGERERREERAHIPELYSGSGG